MCVTISIKNKRCSRTIKCRKTKEGHISSGGWTLAKNELS